jgi:hypothetical protein
MTNDPRPVHDFRGLDPSAPVTSEQLRGLGLPAHVLRQLLSRCDHVGVDGSRAIDRASLEQVLMEQRWRLRRRNS